MDISQSNWVKSCEKREGHNDIRKTHRAVDADDLEQTAIHLPSQKILCHLLDYCIHALYGWTSRESNYSSKNLIKVLDRSVTKLANALVKKCVLCAKVQKNGWKETESSTSWTSKNKSSILEYRSGFFWSNCIKGKVEERVTLVRSQELFIWILLQIV